MKKLGLMLFSFGALILIAGLSDLIVCLNLLNKGHKTEAVITNSYAASNTEKDVTMYEATFKVGYDKYVVENHFQLKDKIFEVGDTVEVLYMPDDPFVARFKTNRELYYVFGSAFIVGISFVILGVVVIFKSKNA